MSVVALLWDDVLGGAEPKNADAAPRGGKRLEGVASPSHLIPPIRPNSPVFPRRVTFASPGVSAKRPVPARCPCRRRRFRPRFQGTLLLLRKENFEIRASYQLAP